MWLLFVYMTYWGAPLEQPIPDALYSFLSELPIVGLVIFLLFHYEKNRQSENEKIREEHREHIIEIMERFEKVSTSQQSAFESILDHHSATISNIIKALNESTKQLSINTEAVAKAAKVDEVLGALIANRIDLEQKQDDP